MSKNPREALLEVFQSREDLRSGDLPIHTLASNGCEVGMRSGKRPVYEAPKEFVALTYSMEPAPTRKVVG